MLKSTHSDRAVEICLSVPVRRPGTVHDVIVTHNIPRSVLAPAVFTRPDQNSRSRLLNIVPLECMCKHHCQDSVQGQGAVGLTTHRSLIFSHTERGICLPSPPNIQGALKPAPGIARTSFDKFGVPPCYREQRSVPRTVERSKAHRCSTETHARTHSSHQTQFRSG